MPEKSFNFINEPEEILLVDCWQHGVQDGIIFHLSFGIRTGPSEGKILKSFAMNINHAKETHEKNFRLARPKY